MTVSKAWCWASAPPSIPGVELITSHSYENNRESGLYWELLYVCRVLGPLHRSTKQGTQAGLPLITVSFCCTFMVHAVTDQQNTDKGSSPHFNWGTCTWICAHLCLCHLRLCREGQLHKDSWVIIQSLLFLLSCFSYIYLLIWGEAHMYAYECGSQSVMAPMWKEENNL